MLQETIRSTEGAGESQASKGLDSASLHQDHFYFIILDHTRCIWQCLAYVFRPKHMKVHALGVDM